MLRLRLLRRGMILDECGPDGAQLSLQLFSDLHSFRQARLCFRRTHGRRLCLCARRVRVREGSVTLRLESPGRGAHCSSSRLRLRRLRPRCCCAPNRLVQPVHPLRRGETLRLVCTKCRRLLLQPADVAQQLLPLLARRVKQPGVPRGPGLEQLQQLLCGPLLVRQARPQHRSFLSRRLQRLQRGSVLRCRHGLVPRV